MQKRLSVPAIFGLLVILVYWFRLHPPGFGALGYLEDFCSDIVRQMMADNLAQHGKPVFHTDRFMAPTGASAPFMSWSIERDWIGAYFWKWNREFPYLWAYFGASLALTYSAVGLILRRMSLLPWAAWGLAAFVTVFHLPRHLKTYYHFEHLPEHWIYLSLFFDAWIWQRIARDRKWSWNSEFWRAWLLLLMLASTGYFWGPLILEWVVVRAFALGAWGLFRSAKIEFHWKKAVLPTALIFVTLALELRWFLPLREEASALGKLWQPLCCSAPTGRLFEPLWLKPLLGKAYPFPPLDVYETAVTLGWAYWIPLFAVLWVIRKKRGGRGLIAIAPHLAFLGLIVMYLRHGFPQGYHELVQKTVPFMEFFRVVSRMGLFLPAAVGALVALGWPELQAWFASNWNSARSLRRNVFRVLVAVFALSTAVEVTRLSEPIKVMPPMDPHLKEFLVDLRTQPGDLVLDMPFCVAGGNGICTTEQCPNYPAATVGQCFRAWHDKRVYGLYQARMTDAHCAIYRDRPYPSWFAAWRDQRCLHDWEWDDFCGYLDQHPDMSAVLVYPDVWKGADTPSCQAQFEARLGRPVREVGYDLVPVPGRGGASGRARVKWYSPRCVRSSSSQPGS